MSTAERACTRINVVGTSGSGKTTFARALSDRLGSPCYEMDQMFWKPDWQTSSEEELLDKLRLATAGPCWILDGNYTRTLSEKWKYVQVVIWLDLSFFRTVFRVCARAVRRSLDGQEIWPDTGNCESLRRTFLSRESVVWWAIQTYHANRKKYRALMASPDYSHIRFVRLRSPVEIHAFLDLAGGERLPRELKT